MRHSSRHMFWFALSLVGLALAGPVSAGEIPRHQTVDQAGERQLRLGHIYWQGEEADSARVDLPFDSLAVAEATNEVLAKWLATGHYYARARVDSVTLTGETASLYLTIAPGPVVKIASNRLTGLNFTNLDFLNKLLGDFKGQPLTDERLARATAIASRLEFIQAVPPVVPLPREGYTEVDLGYRFRERGRVSIFGGLGYLDDGRTGLVWNLSASFRNLFGRGRQIQLEADRRDANRQTLDLSFRQPLFWFGRGSLMAELSSRDYRDQFSEFSTGLGLKSQMGQVSSVGLTVGFKRVEPADSTTGFSRYNISLTLERSTVAQPANPGSGYTLTSSISYSHRRYSVDSLAVVPIRMVVGESRAKLSVDFYQAVFSKLVVRVGATYLGYETPEANPPLSELYLLGGPGSLRGYRNDRFAVRRAGLMSFEPRWRLSKAFLFLFYDALWFTGSHASAAVDSSVQRVYHGYGLGFSIQGEAMAVALSLGWQPESAIDQPRLTVEVRSGR